MICVVVFHLRGKYSSLACFLEAALCSMSWFNSDTWWSMRPWQETQQADIQGLREMQVHSNSTSQKTTKKLRLAFQGFPLVLLSSEQLNHVEGTVHLVCCILALIDCCILFPCYSPPMTLHCGWPCRKTLEGIFGHIVKLNYTLRFSNCCVILSLHAAAPPSFLHFYYWPLQMLFNGVFNWRSGPEGMLCSAGVFLSVDFPGLTFYSVFNWGCNWRWI